MYGYLNFMTFFFAPNATKCADTHTATHTHRALYTHSNISKGSEGGEKRDGGYYVPMPVALNTL